MGRASRGKWARRRKRMLSMPGSLGMRIRSLLLLEKHEEKLAKVVEAYSGNGKDGRLRAAWWLRDQHLKHGKYTRQRGWSYSMRPIAHPLLEPTYPQFPSIAAMLEHFKEEQEQPRKEQP